MEKLLDNNKSLQIKPRHPDKPVSRGATAFHEAVINSTWIKDIIYELVKQMRNQAGQRQVSNVNYSLAQNIGGAESNVTMHILKKVSI